MTYIKTFFNIILRIILFLPLAFLAYTFNGLSQLFQRISDGLFDMATAMRQITMLPYVKEIKHAVEGAKQHEIQNLYNHLK